MFELLHGSKHINSRYIISKVLKILVFTQHFFTYVIEGNKYKNIVFL